VKPIGKKAKEYPAAPKPRPMPSASVGLSSFVGQALLRKLRAEKVTSQENKLNQGKSKPQKKKKGTKKKTSRGDEAHRKPGKAQILRRRDETGKIRSGKVRKATKKRLSSVKIALFRERRHRWFLLRPDICPVPLKLHPALQNYVGISPPTASETNKSVSSTDSLGSTALVEHGLSPVFSDLQKAVGGGEEQTGKGESVSEAPTMREVEAGAEVVRNSSRSILLNRKDISGDGSEEGTEKVSDDIKEPTCMGGGDEEVESSNEEGNRDDDNKLEREVRGGESSQGEADDDCSATEADEDNDSETQDEERKNNSFREGAKDSDSKCESSDDGQTGEVASETSDTVADLVSVLHDPKNWDARLLSPVFFGCSVAPRAVLKETDLNISGGEVPSLERSEGSTLRDADSMLVNMGSSEVKASKLVRQRMGNVLVVREYVQQSLSRSLDMLVTTMLSRLMELQLRQREKDPLKAAMRRRLVLGFREVVRGVRTRRCKCIIVATNIEHGGGTVAGRLDRAVADLLEKCRPTEDEQERGDEGVKVVFALNTGKLGAAVKKSIKVSAVGLYSTDGAHEDFKSIVKLHSQLQTFWHSVVDQERSSGEYACCDECHAFIEDVRHDCMACKRVRCTRCGNRARSLSTPCPAAGDAVLSLKGTDDATPKPCQLVRTPRSVPSDCAERGREKQRKLQEQAAHEKKLELLEKAKTIKTRSAAARAERLRNAKDSGKVYTPASTKSKPLSASAQEFKLATNSNVQPATPQQKLNASVAAFVPRQNP